MSPDDLNAPLGQNSSEKRAKFPLSGPQVLAGLLGLFGIAVVASAVFINDPLGGEPKAVVATEPDIAKPDKGDAAQNHDRYDGPSVVVATPPAAAEAEKTVPTVPPGAKTVTIINGATGNRQEIVIPGTGGSTIAPKAPAGDKRLLELTPQGALPQIAPDGTRPYAAYAQPRKLPDNRTDAPRMAIVLGGLGISTSATADALTKLPAPITFALAPYSNGLEALAQSARGQGHEVLLQVPMEPFDYPNNDPGPRTLLTSLTPEQNVDRLHWLMARFQGYVGLISYMGGKFTSSEQALTPVLKEAAKRGLLYVDDGSSPRNVAGQLAGGNGVPFAKAEIVLDEVPTPVEIDRALARLEMAAREHGSAVGFASARPTVIARIAEWAKKVEARGFVLVPITMVALKEKSS